MVAGGSAHYEAQRSLLEAGEYERLAAEARHQAQRYTLTAQALWPVLVFAGRRIDERAQQVHLVGESNLATWLTRLGRRLDPAEVAQVYDLLDDQFPAYDTDNAAKATVVK